MLSDGARKELDGRLESLWGMIRPGSRHDDIASTVSVILDDYTAGSMHDDNKLMPPGWRESYQRGNDIVCGLFSDGSGDPVDNRRYDLFMAMVAFEADGYAMPDTGQSLRVGLSRYLYAVNGKDYQVANNSDADEAKPDGPIGDGFRWKGRDHRGLAGKPWRLVGYLWSRDSRTATFDELADPVWEDREEVPSKDAVGSLRRNANTFLEGNQIPFRIAINGQTVHMKPE